MTGTSLVVALALVVTLAQAARAAGPVLREVGDVHGWTGVFHSPDDCPSGTCTVDRFSIALTAAASAGAAGVLVSVHWTDDPGADLDLLVTGPDGVVRTSAYAGGDTEAVLLAVPAVGDYEVAVYPAAADDLAYAGQVTVVPKLAAEPLRDLLPDLVPLPPRQVGFPTVGLTGSCREEEAAEKQALRCMRVDQRIANVGDGPLELRYSADAVSLATTRAIYQRIRGSDGTFRDRLAGTYEFHASHRHFHYTGFAVTRLWAADAAGHRLARAPVREGRKNGFCLIDMLDLRFAQAGDTAPAYRRCHDATEAGLPGQVLVNGISPGWVDVYEWSLPDQYVEVTGVPDGYYVLETVVDPDGTVVEADETDNAVSVLIRLAGDTAQVVQ